MFRERPTRRGRLAYYRSGRELAIKIFRIKVRVESRVEISNGYTERELKLFRTLRFRSIDRSIVSKVFETWIRTRIVGKFGSVGLETKFRRTYARWKVHAGEKGRGGRGCKSGGGGEAWRGAAALDPDINFRGNPRLSASCPHTASPSSANGRKTRGKARPTRLRSLIFRGARLSILSVRREAKMYIS